MAVTRIMAIAHISKATALHLLHHGLVPCKDTGKKTRRYTIRTDDVIFYMIDRQIHPEIYRAPDKWYQERSGHYNSRITCRNELSKLTDDEKICMCQRDWRSDQAPLCDNRIS